jgi:hypothetical protein
MVVEHFGYPAKAPLMRISAQIQDVDPAVLRREDVRKDG